MNCDDIQLLLADFESGRLPAADARRVREHLAGCPACAHARELQRRLDLAIKQAPAPEPGAHLHAAFHAWLETEVRAAAGAPPAREPVRVSFWSRPAVASGLVALAACAVFALGVGLGARLPGGAVDTQTAGELAALREQVDVMRQAVAWGVLQQQSATDRLQAVGTLAASPAGEAVANELLGVLAYDPSERVRESAVHALYRHAGTPAVRTAVARALARESSPAVQLAMIDLLAASRAPEAAGALQNLVYNQDQNPLVREAATYALARL